MCSLLYKNFTKLRHCHNYMTRNSEYSFWVPTVKGQQKETFYFNGNKKKLEYIAK